MSRSDPNNFSKWGPKSYSGYPYGPACRCAICGQKNADDNHIRRDYLRVNITRDGPIWGEMKTVSRRLRRTREKRTFQRELTKGLV